MGWKTDWLYGLIFDRIHEVWWKALGENDRWNQDARRIIYPEERQPFMEHLLVRQSADADLAEGIPRGEILQTWHYAGKEFELILRGTNEAVVVRRKQTINGLQCIFFTQGVVTFAISPDRK